MKPGEMIGVDAADVRDLGAVGAHPRHRRARRLVDPPRVRGVALREVEAIALDEASLRPLVDSDGLR